MYNELKTLAKKKDAKVLVQRHEIIRTRDKYFDIKHVNQQK